ncbi:MAG: hypothetical protein OEV72_01340 [Thermoleophilia bacterium]|nr:hypothetical protein [Thermoleophilia bacterium]
MRWLVLTVGLVIAIGAAASSALAAQDQTPAKQDVFLYVDTVNGSRPVGVAPRPLSCTQTNNFKRGEQVVFRAWGSEAATGDILSTENVKSGVVQVPGVAEPLKLNWGAHGATSNRVWFWTAAWVIPADYPLGTANVKVVIETEAGKFARYDYSLTVTPSSALKKGLKAKRATARKK